MIERKDSAVNWKSNFHVFSSFFIPFVWLTIIIWNSSLFNKLLC